MINESERQKRPPVGWVFSLSFAFKQFRFPPFEATANETTQPIIIF